jgi:hypothetical protein
MANANFIVQNGINIGGSSGANISVDSTTGALVFAPAPTTAIPNPTAVVFTAAGTVQTVATTGGAAAGSAIATANAASATTLTNGTANVTVNTANITMGVGGTQVWTVTSSGVTGAGSAQFNSLNVPGTITAATLNAATIGNTGATLTGTLQTAAQTNITSVGTLSGLTVSGTTVLQGNVNITSAQGEWVTNNLYVSGTLTVAGNTTTVNATTVTTNDLQYIAAASAGTSSAANNAGLVTPYSLFTFNSTASAWQSNIAIIPTANASVNLGSSSAYWNGLYSATATHNTVTVGGGGLQPAANSAINIGSTSSWFATIYGTSTHAQYADLAENYQADKVYAPGTVLMFGGDFEVTLADADTPAVAGVVSTNPAHLMNGGLTGPNVAPLALQGRVPCNVIGPVKKGDLMVSAGHGFAKSVTNPAIGTVIGKALYNYPGQGKAVIELVVGRV